LGEHLAPVRSEVAGPGRQEHLVLLPHHLVDGERDPGIRDVDDHVDLVAVDPRARDAGADVGLVLVVGADDLDLHVLLRGGEILHRLAGGEHRALPAEIGVEPRHVVEHADPDHAVAILGARGPAGGHRGNCRQPGRGKGEEASHREFLPWVRRHHTPRYS